MTKRIAWTAFWIALFALALGMTLHDARADGPWDTRDGNAVFLTFVDPEDVEIVPVQIDPTIPLQEIDALSVTCQSGACIEKSRCAGPCMVRGAVHTGGVPMYLWGGNCELGKLCGQPDEQLTSTPAEEQAFCACKIKPRCPPSHQIISERTDNTGRLVYLIAPYSGAYGAERAAAGECGGAR